MGVLKRFKDIMAANINALLDKCEDPAKMVDQYLRDMQDDLGKVKAETAAVMAEETKAKRDLDGITADIAKMQGYAEKAILAGNEEDAKRFLTQKQNLQSQQATAQQLYDVAAANSAKMRQMHDKLTKDIALLNERKATIKAKVAAAEAQKKINDLSQKVGGMNVTDGMSAFDRMEDKANQMLDQANAMAELNTPTQDSVSIDELASKYDNGSSQSVDDELAALKAQLGM